jgi:hypothetical protein
LDLLALLIAGIYALLSSLVSMSAGELLSPDPLSAPFTLTNASTFFTLSDIEPSCVVNSIKARNQREVTDGTITNEV